jgi:hypothetical protein
MEEDFERKSDFRMPVDVGTSFVTLVEQKKKKNTND